VKDPGCHCASPGTAAVKCQSPAEPVWVWQRAFVPLKILRVLMIFLPQPPAFLVRFELIFVKSIRSVSRIFFLHVNVQLLQHPLLKGWSLPR
jgi:hypothetical protein